jgi:hypothetical protein
MAIPFSFMIINKLLLSPPIQWRHIKDLVVFTVSRVKGMFHFENINFEGRVDHIHQYHPIEKDVDLGLALGKHFILLQNCCGVDVVRLDNTNCPIKKQVVHHFHSSRNLACLDFSHECIEKKNKINKTFLKVKSYLSNVHNFKLCSFISL